MWSPEIDDFSLKEQDIPAEFRTDIDHLQVIMMDTGVFLLRSSSRQYDSKVDLYTPWSDWEIESKDLPLPTIMWMFSSLVLEKSAVDEYRWSAAMRE
ncbi:MAG: hypothetical protein ACTSUB_01740 [Candidatus Thorarchaeota archaeon]